MVFIISFRNNHAIAPQSSKADRGKVNIFLLIRLLTRHQRNINGYRESSDYRYLNFIKVIKKFFYSFCPDVIFLLQQFQVGGKYLPEAGIRVSGKHILKLVQFCG